MLKLSKILLSSALLFHFFVLFWYLAPDNPISHQFKYYISRYVNPLFTQTWNLFAPNPINTDQFINLRFIEYRDGAVSTSPYLDISSPIDLERKKSFFNANQRLSKFLSGNNQELLELYRQANDYITSDSLVGDSVVLAGNLIKLYNNSSGRRIINSYGGLVYYNYSQSTVGNLTKADSVYIQCKIVNREFPRFSMRKLDPRDDENCKFSHIEFPAVLLH